MKKLMLIITVIFLMTSGMTTQRTITGTVTDPENNPIAGANVLIKGTMTGTATDQYGRFSLRINTDNDILVISFIGCVTQEIQVGSASSFSIILQQDVAQLQEVVVTGYASSHRKDKSASSAPPVMNGSTQGIRIRGINSYRNQSANYPSTPQLSNEGYSAINENGFKNPLKEPLSTFSIDVDAASYSNVRRFIMEGQKPVADAVRIEEMINYFDYDYPQPHNGHPFSISYELGECPWNSDNQLLHIGLQGEKMNSDEVPPSNLVFLIDVSGSMSSENKLPLVKKAMKLLVSRLREQDRVAIVVYAGNSGLVLPSTSGSHKDRIDNALEMLQSGGSTAGSAGLKLAYEIAEQNYIEDGNNRIILATDGDFNVGPSSNAEMERLIESYRKKGIFISVTGFGMGNYKDDKMEIIADKGNGNYAYIDNIMEAKKVFINEFSSTLYTIAKDVKIQIEFNPAYVKEYRLVGYENRMLNEEDFENDRKDAGEMGAGHSVTALYEIVPVRKGNGSRQLKYQQSVVADEAIENNELATIKFRYKKPEGDKSILMTEVIPAAVLPVKETSDNFRFSAAVAGFGMLLRDSEYKGTIDLEDIILMAKGAKGSDEDGYRAEFIRLVELTETNFTSMNDSY